MFSTRRMLLATVCAGCALLAAVRAEALPFNAGDLIVSVVGNVDGSAPGDNQASPIQLIELTTTGTVVGSMLLPQTASGSNYAISGEYGSSSEGLLHLSANGQSLVIAGYGVNAATFNAGGAAVYGNAALAQTTSVPGGAVTAVPRVIADINVSGAVDTSTALYNAFDQNNPRSVATVDGTSFYIAGQGASKTDTATQGVFYVKDGTTSTAPTQITGSTDFRSVSIQNGALYASRDNNGAAGAQNTEIDRFATALPTGASAPTALAGIGPSLNLSAASFNKVNNSRGAGNSAYLSRRITSSSRTRPPATSTSTSPTPGTPRTAISARQASVSAGFRSGSSSTASGRSSTTSTTACRSCRISAAAMPQQQAPAG